MQNFSSHLDCDGQRRILVRRIVDLFNESLDDPSIKLGVSINGHLGGDFVDPLM